MSALTRKLRLKGELQYVRQACDFVAEAAREFGLSEDSVFHCELSVEEIFANIVEHGYEFNGADKSIEIHVTYDSQGLIITLIDESPEFNPLEVKEADPTTPLWERQTGGWGVFFVRNLMDDVRYKFIEGRNHLVLEKKRSLTA